MKMVHVLPTSWTGSPEVLSFETGRFSLSLSLMRCISLKTKVHRAARILNVTFRDEHAAYSVYPRRLFSYVTKNCSAFWDFINSQNFPRVDGQLSRHRSL